MRSPKWARLFSRVGYHRHALPHLIVLHARYSLFWVLLCTATSYLNTLQNESIITAYHFIEPSRMCESWSSSSDWLSLTRIGARSRTRRWGSMPLARVSMSDEV